MCFIQKGAIHAQIGSPLKLVAHFTYLGSYISTKSYVNTRLAKAWNAIDSLSIVWKSDLSNKIKQDFFQGLIVSILLNGFITWMQTKCAVKALVGNYTRMLRAVLNKFWKQDPTKQQLYDHLTPISQNIETKDEHDML